MSDDKDIQQAIMHGIQEAKTEQARQENEKSQKDLHARSRLTSVYNEASSLLAGLEILKKMPHSKFNFEVLEDDERVWIRTNIPEGKGVESINFVDGEIVVPGWSSRGIRGMPLFPDKVQSPEAAPIVEVIAKKAALKGLIK